MPIASPTSPPSFNGAATFRPRKAPTRWDGAPDRHSFNGAATFRPRKVRVMQRERRADGGLQWGRDLSAAEGRAAARNHRPHAASMGPRPFGRGRPANFTVRKPCATRFNGAATFRPRKEAKALAETLYDLALQWGRDLSAAEGRLT